MKNIYAATIKLSVAFALAAPLIVAHAALPNGTVLQFDAGVPSYGSNGNFIDVASGSYFAVDTDGNGMFGNSEKLVISMHDGIILGTSQPASGSHSGPVDGTEVPGIDNPWAFFGNTGMFQTLSPVTDYGDGTLDFSGIGATWNGIPNIPIGSVPDFGDTLRATIVCSSSPCQVGDTYTLDYQGHVPLGDASGFGGVHFKVHLVGTIVDGSTFARVTINAIGGTQQECSTTGGSLVTLDASVTVPPGDSVSAINWSLDGVSIGTGVQIVPLVPLGAHSLLVELQTQGGLSATATSNLTIEDTQAPVVSAAFINTRTGQPVSHVNRNSQLGIRASAADVCDSNPTVQSTVGAPVSDGGVVTVLVSQDKVSISVPTMTLAVTANDASNNSASGAATLTIGQ